MQIITERVHPDEPAWAYFTGPRMMPGYDEAEACRMVEFVFVIRDDAIAKYVRDFGPASTFPYIPPMFMPSFGEETVACLQWHGERHRNDPKWARRLQEYKEGSTLFADIIRQEEQRHLFIKNLSVFGPAVSVQRNEWSHETSWRNYRDRRAGKTGPVLNLPKGR